MKSEGRVAGAAAEYADDKGLYLQRESQGL
ncbi:hypothetical protein HC248_02923 [Polaromonas vacuolata]|uniref:Uncharacterized protein n=1 Tax=Polaromonas vacuolata TaxID=37448 RepID=A0A6H2HCS0_9BURK|nr:hypothetical protein HC248_02923 [Polaromonas vacuolata]